MAALITRAADKQRAAMYQLIEKYKKRAFYTATLLMGDDDLAAKAVITAFNGIWNAMSADMTEAQFEEALMVAVTEQCQKEIAAKDRKAWRLPQDRRFVTAPTVAVKTEGDTTLDIIKVNFSTLQWGVFVLHLVSGLPRATQAALLKMDSHTLDIAVDAQVQNIERILRETTPDTSYDDVVAMLVENGKSTRVPDVIKQQTEAAVRTITAPLEKKARIKTIKTTALIVGVTVGVLGLCWAAIMSLSGVEDDPHGDSTGETAADTTINNDTAVVTTVENPTHYAEITLTDYGTIKVALDANTAPITVENFKKLADMHFYDSLTFHRIIEGFMMQGGDPKSDGTGGSDETIVGEFSSNGHDNPMSHVRGAISMARATDPNSASSQFFIVHEDSIHLDGDYAVFGYVTEGMDIVDAICESAEPLDSNGTIELGDQPMIETITVYEATAE